MTDIKTKAAELKTRCLEVMHAMEETDGGGSRANGGMFDHYFDAVRDTIRDNFELLFESHPPFMTEAWPLLPVAVVLLAGMALLIVTRTPSRDDALLVLAKGSIAGALVYLALLPTPTYLRRELALLPAAAIGIAVGVDLLSRWLATRRAPDPRFRASRTPLHRD